MADSNDQVIDIYRDRSPAGIAARLEISRKVLGFTQQEFANTAGIKRANYSHAETGRYRPSVSVAAKLCDTYLLTLDWIYLGEIGALPTRLADAIRKAHDSRQDLQQQMKPTVGKKR